MTIQERDTAADAGERVDCAIRRAVAADAAVLAALGESIFVDTFAADNDPDDMAAYLAVTYGESHQRREIESTDNVVLLAEIEGSAAGYALVRRPRVDDDEREVLLARFYISRPWHGRGIAQTLMRAVEEVAYELGGRRLRLTVWERNFRAIAFYTKNGFLPVGTEPFILGSDLQTDLVMARELPPRPKP